MQGPRPATSSHLIPPRVVSARKASSSRKQLSTHDGSAVGATGTSDVAVALKKSHAFALANLRTNMHHDPLACASTTTEILLKVEACRRQLQTLELLLSTDHQRLALLNEAAKGVMTSLQLVPKLEERGSSAVDPDLLSELLSLAAEGGSASTQSTCVPCAKFLSNYPRALLSAEEADDVNAFSNKLHETLDEVQLLEMLQLHESQNLGHEEARLRSLRAVEEEDEAENAGDPQSEQRGSPVRTHHAAPVVAHYVPSPGHDEASGPTTTTTTTGSPLRLRPMWVKYFAHPDASRIANAPGTDDQKCCSLIDDLLEQLTLLRQSLDEETSRSRELEKQLEDTSRRLALHEDEAAKLHDALATSSSQRDELHSLLVDSNGGGAALKTELGLMGARNLELAETLSRQTWMHMQEMQFGELEKNQLREFLVVAARQRSNLEHMLSIERRIVEVERKKNQKLADTQVGHDALQRELREELASCGAERALQKAKIDMYQQTIRADQDRYNKGMLMMESECTSLRERVVHLEAQLDVQRSTTVTRLASFKAVQQQKDWDQGTLVRQLSMNSSNSHSPPPRISSNDDAAPTPRAYQPPRPTN